MYYCLSFDISHDNDFFKFYPIRLDPYLKKFRGELPLIPPDIHDKFKHMKISKLYEHPITRSGQISLADQIHDILCEEIHADRWRVGEKLPSMMVIASQCGVSRMPVQQAIERLGEEGYVRQENRSGIFLASKMPEGREPIGTIGVVVLADPQTDREVEHLAYEQLIVHRVMQEASKRNYQIRVHYANVRNDWKNINVAGHVFDRNIKGIISMVPFERIEADSLAADRIPLVFLCEPDHRCAPCVASDYEMAFCQLTARLIAKGHEKIIPLASPTITNSLNQTYLSGYRKAMNTHGLPCLENSFEESKTIGIRDTVGLKALLEKQNDATAFACMSNVSAERAEQVINTLTLMGVSVPEEVSVAGTNPLRNPLPNGQKLSGVGFSAENEIEMCFQLLREQGLSRNFSIGTLLMRPSLIEGDTIAEK